LIAHNFDIDFIMSPFFGGSRFSRSVGRTLRVSDAQFYIMGDGLYNFPISIFAPAMTDNTTILF